MDEFNVSLSSSCMCAQEVWGKLHGGLNLRTCRPMDPTMHRRTMDWTRGGGGGPRETNPPPSVRTPNKYPLLPMQRCPDSGALEEARAPPHPRLGSRAIVGVLVEGREKKLGVVRVLLVVKVGLLQGFHKRERGHQLARPNKSRGAHGSATGRMEWCMGRQQGCQSRLW